MQTTLLHYHVLIQKEGKDYVAYVPTLGISDFGKSVEEAQKHIKEAIETHIGGLIKTDTEVPAPDTNEMFISSTEITVPSTIKFAV